MRSWASSARVPSGKSRRRPIQHDLPYSDTFTSEVHRARSKKTGALVALKKIIMHNEKDGVSAPLQ